MTTIPRRPTPTTSGNRRARPVGRRLLAAVAAAGALALVACQNADGAASSFPDRKVTMVVPFAAGSSSDVSARIYAPCLEDQLDTPLVIENRDGGNGAIAFNDVARAKPDGYTIVLGSSSSVVIAPYYSPEVGYSIDDFDFIGAYTVSPAFVFVAGSSPARSMADLISGGRQVFATSGPRTNNGLVVTMLAKRYGMNAEQVAYGGLGEARRGLTEGDYTVAVVPISSETITWFEDPGLRVLATVGGTRTSYAPDVATLSELGFPEANLPGPGVIGFLAAPAGTDGAAMTALTDALRACATSAAVKEKLAPAGADPFQDGAAVRQALTEYRTFVEATGTK